MSLEDDDWNAFTGIKVLKPGEEPVVELVINAIGAKMY